MGRKVFHRLKIQQSSPAGGTYISIDGEPIRCREYTLHESIDEVPYCVMELIGKPEIDVYSKIDLSFAPHTVEESCGVLVSELSKRTIFYDAFVRSVQSAIIEADTNDTFTLSRKIVDRLIGDDIYD